MYHGPYANLRDEINHVLKDHLSPAYQAKLDAIFDRDEGKTLEIKDAGRASFPGERISTATGQESPESSTATSNPNEARSQTQAERNARR